MTMLHNCYTPKNKNFCQIVSLFSCTRDIINLADHDLEFLQEYCNAFSYINSNAVFHDVNNAKCFTSERKATYIL